MFFSQSTRESLLVSNRYRRPYLSGRWREHTRIKPRRAQITKEQRHEQEIYFGADADHRDGIRADRQLQLDT
jgi:hypothetical protein